jgi:hypothetical protein
MRIVVVRVMASLAVLVSPAARTVEAETPPCGRALVVVSKDGKASEERFVAAPVEHVQASAVRALPAVGAKLEEKDGIVSTGGGVRLRAVSDIARFSDRTLYSLWKNTNKSAGVKGIWGGTTVGKWVIELTSATAQGTPGTNVKISFDKKVGWSANGATPLIEEIACLSGLLSTSDPVADPRGVGQADEPGGAGELALPEGTPVKVVLREPLYSKDLGGKGGPDLKLVFEVAADVAIDGVPVIRKGALALGKITDSKGPGSFGRSAELKFVVEQVIAVDGEPVVVRGAVETQRSKDVSTAAVPNYGAAGVLLGGLLSKGSDALVRAGTAYDVEVSAARTVKAGK